MLGNLKVCLVSALDCAQETQKLNNLANLFARYTCRLIGAREFRKEIRLLFYGLDDLQREVLCMKEDLDYSILKNRLFRAIHKLSNCKKVTKKQILVCADVYSVDCDDLSFFYRSLSRDDVKAVSIKEIRDYEYTESEILQILGKVERLMKGLAHKKLHFVLANDPMIEKLEDLVGPLHVGVMKVIRDSEILDITAAHMLGKVIRTVRNEVVNLTARHGRGKRKVVRRVKERLDNREAFYLNIQDGSILPVTTFPGLEYRIKKEGNIHIAVLYTNEETDEADWLIVHLKRLYETRTEAEQAWVDRQAGKRSKRRYYIDPSPQEIDDFQLNVISLDALDEDENRPNYSEILTADTTSWTQIEDQTHAKEMISKLSPHLQEFAELVFNEAVDELFDAWCEEQGIDPTTCDLSQLGRAARGYMGVTRPQLKNELLDSPHSVWEDAYQEAIVSHAHLQ